MRPVVDAHVHVWAPAVVEYPWLARAPVLGRPHLPSGIDDGEGVVRSWVAVEADASRSAALAEVLWLESLEWPGLRAIVAQADLQHPALDEHLGMLAAHPLVRGVRHLLQDEAPAVFDSAATSEGLAAVGRAGLTFDACVRWWQLPALWELVTRASETAIVLDHLAKPPVDAGLHSDDGRDWRDGMSRLADLPQVVVKLSGLPAEASSPGVLTSHGPDFLRATLDLFGADRCLFGTDGPVSGRAATGVSTAGWLGLVSDALEGHDADAVFAGTAERVYRLSATAPPG